VAVQALQPGCGGDAAALCGEDSILHKLQAMRQSASHAGSCESVFLYVKWEMRCMQTLPGLAYVQRQAAGFSSWGAGGKHGQALWPLDGNGWRQACWCGLGSGFHWASIGHRAQRAASGARPLDRMHQLLRGAAALQWDTCQAGACWPRLQQGRRTGLAADTCSALQCWPALCSAGPVGELRRAVHAAWGLPLLACRVASQ
jgi:hypothetical protein